MLSEITTAFQIDFISKCRIKVEGPTAFSATLGDPDDGLYYVVPSNAYQVGSVDLATIQAYIENQKNV